MVLQHARDCRLDAVPDIDAVEQDLARGVGRQHELVDRHVRDRDRVHDQQVASAPAVECVDLALQVVAVIERLGERVLDPLALAVANRRPFAGAALDAPALHLEADDPLVRMAEHEVDLPVDCACPCRRRSS